MHSLLPWASFGSGPSCLQHAPQHIGLAMELERLDQLNCRLGHERDGELQVALVCQGVHCRGAGPPAHVKPALSAYPDRLGSGSANAGRRWSRSSAAAAGYMSCSTQAVTGALTGTHQTSR